MSQKDLSKTIPYGDLGIIPLESSKAIGKKVDDYIVGWRNEADVDSSFILPITKGILTSSMPYAHVLGPVKQRVS